MSRSTSVIPGFGLTLGYTLVYLSLLVLIPWVRCFSRPPNSPGRSSSPSSARRACWRRSLSFGTAFAAAVLNGVIGTLLAWVLVRYRFPAARSSRR